ncbi:hypothetical protein RJ639_047832 [Escallonia herrerae]|uniref:Uncharacterized protein n=1 Tax=Escallonia herrerae TaxID=1293975 RepID=A0AA89B3J4_9ASTE|nr:hypothetical protein RJ639_047832 [Escallonia herrerae]
MEGEMAILHDMTYHDFDDQVKIVLASMVAHNYIRKNGCFDIAFDIAEQERYSPNDANGRYDNNEGGTLSTGESNVRPTVYLASSIAELNLFSSAAEQLPSSTTRSSEGLISQKIDLTTSSTCFKRVSTMVIIKEVTGSMLWIPLVTTGAEIWS